MKHGVQLSIPIDEFAQLKNATDILIQEIGYYQLKVSRLLDPEFVPGAESLDDAVGEVAKLIYRNDEAA